MEPQLRKKDIGMKSQTARNLGHGQGSAEETKILLKSPMSQRVAEQMVTVVERQEDLEKTVFHYEVGKEVWAHCYCSQLSSSR
jgi:hypothetical protein